MPIPTNLLIYKALDESAGRRKKEKSSMQLISDLRLVSAARESPELYLASSLAAP